MSKRFVNPSQRTSLLFRLTSPKIYMKTRHCIDVMHKFTTDVIEKRREALEAALKDGSYKKSMFTFNLNKETKRSLLTN